MKAIWKIITLIIEIIAGTMVSTIAVLVIFDILGMLVKGNSFLYSIVQIFYAFALVAAWILVVLYVVRKRTMKKAFVPVTPIERHALCAKRNKPKRSKMRLFLGLFALISGIFLINFRSVTRPERNY